MALFDLMISPQGLALDRHLVRYTGHSLINRVFARKAGIAAQPALLLRTKGRKTGLWRDAVLPWFRDGGSRIVVGSNGGQASDPRWVDNLRDDPEAEIFVDRTLQFVHSRFLDGEQYDAAWQRLCQTVPTYAVYQSNCEGQREIPLIVLDTV